MKNLTMMIIMLFLSTSVFSADPLDPPSMLYMNSGVDDNGRDNLNGDGNIDFECSVNTLGMRSDAGHDLATFIDGSQVNALANADYIEGAFPACRAAMGCGPGQSFMTKSESGYHERTIVQVTCGLEPFDIFREVSGVVEMDRRLYKSPAINDLEKCNPIVAETSAAESPVDANDKCMGKLTGGDYQGGKYQRWQRYKRIDHPPVTDPITGITTTPPPTYQALSEYFFKDVLTGKLVTDSRVDPSTMHRVLKKGRTVGSTNFNDYWYYANDQKYTRSEVKYQLNEFKLNISKNGSILPTGYTACASPGSACQEGVKLMRLGNENGADIDVLNVNGKSTVTFYAVIRNRGAAQSGVEFSAKLAGRLTVKKNSDNTSLYGSQTAGKFIGADGDGGIAHLNYNNATSVDLEDKIEIADLNDVSCIMEFDGRDEGKSGENYLGQSGGIDVWAIDYAVKNKKVPVTPVLVGDLPDYLKYPNRDHIIWPSGQDAYALNISEDASALEQMANTRGEVTLEDVNAEYTIGAEVKLGGDESRKIMCKKEKLKRLPKPKTIGLTPYNECGVFVGLRDYYFDGVSTDPMEIPGDSEATLPAQSLPLVGLYNTAQWGRTSTDSPKVSEEKAMQIEYSNGSPVMPRSPRQRLYPKTYLLVRPFTKEGIKPPIMYGQIGQDGDMSSVKLKNVEGVDVEAMVQESLPAEGESDREPVDHMVVVEIIAKGYNPDGGFGPNSERFQFHRGVDKPVAFASGSCLSKMPFYLPFKKEGDQPVRFPAAIENASLCQYSIPIKLKDIHDGLANLQVMSLAPRSRLDTYPVELMRRSATTQSCSKDAGGSMIDCWDIKSYIPAAASHKPKVTHDQCHTRVCKDYTATYPCGPYGQNTCTSPEPVTVCHDEYKATCSVLETDSENECNSNMAFRFDGYFNQMVASLGCVAKYNGLPNDEIRDPANSDKKVNLSGVTVAATLFDEGIMPYQENANTEVTGSEAVGGATGGALTTAQVSMGGSDPKRYNNYPSDKVQKSSDGNDEPLGYQCIPCQFDLPWLNGGLKTTPLPVDQGSTQNPRKPEYSFTKRQEPSDCVKETTFEVRYFGSGACNGIDTPPGHMCASRNLNPQTCPATGGNVAGTFSVKLCSGSQFGTSNVSASWSPILIDVVGKNIEVTRSADMAVDFDMKGEGKKMLVDWPLNTYDVAFLVEPDENGQVTSAKQLFGDLGYKNGFEKLMKKYDKDAKGKSNGKVNSKDVAFSKLRLWFDRNRNGVTDLGEIETLEEHGVYEISLDYVRSAGEGLESRTLSATYWNAKKQRYMNVVDAYFGAHSSRYHGKISVKGTGVNRTLSSEKENGIRKLKEVSMLRVKK